MLCMLEGLPHPPVYALAIVMLLFGGAPVDQESQPEARAIRPLRAGRRASPSMAFEFRT